jgi:hypothetical protein
MSLHFFDKCCIFPDVRLASVTENTVDGLKCKSLIEGVKGRTAVLMFGHK